MILLTGDSLIANHEGLSEPMLDHYLQKKADLEIINTGIPGDDSDHLLARFSQDVLAYQKAEKVFILIGTNDLARGKQVPLGAFGENIKEMIRQLKEHWKGSDIYFISPPAVDESRQITRDNQLIKRYADYLEKIVAENQCRFIDFYQAVADRDISTIMQGQENDGLHFGEKGYDLLSDLILNAKEEAENGSE